MFYFVIIINLVINIALASYCPLKWVYASGIGGFNLANRVESNSVHSVVRIFQQSQNYYQSGRLTRGQSAAYIPYYGEKEYKSYEVLTNPNGCKLEWVYSSNGNAPPNAVGGDEFEDRGYIAREIGSIWLPGKLCPKNGHAFVSWSGKEHKKHEYQVLTSIGVEVDVTNITYYLPTLPGNLGNEAIVGTSILINNSTATLRQTLITRADVQQSYSYTFTKSWSHTFNIKFSISFPIKIFNVNLETSYEYREEQSESKTFSGSTELSMEISREVELPPYSNVTVTDTIIMVENYPINFKATGRFYGEGMTGQVVKNLLGSGFDGEIFRTSSDAVYAYIKGTFRGRWGYSIKENLQSSANIKVLNKSVKQVEN